MIFRGYHHHLREKLMMIETETGPHTGDCQSHRSWFLSCKQPMLGRRWWCSCGAGQHRQIYSSLYIIINGCQYSSMYSITCIFIKTIWTLIKFCQTAEARAITKSRYAIASLQMEFYVFCFSPCPRPMPTDKIMKKLPIQTRMGTKSISSGIIFTLLRLMVSWLLLLGVGLQVRV